MLLSLLLGNQPPRSTVQRLVRTAELFGITEGTARTALSRMTAAGEVRSVDGWCELASPDLLVRQARQDLSRRATTHPWVGGRWIQAVVAADRPRSAPQRAETRRLLTRARLAEMREGVWLRPDNLGGVPALEVDLVWFSVTPTDDGRDLASRLWDLESWAARAEALVHDMHRVLLRLERHEHAVLAEGFVISADVLRHFQSDPLLPGQLLDADWPGDRLRTVYDTYDAAYRRLLAEWFGSGRP